MTQATTPITAFVRIRLAQLERDIIDRLTFCLHLFDDALRHRIPLSTLDTTLRACISSHRRFYGDAIDVDADITLVLSSLYSTLAPELLDAPERRIPSTPQGGKVARTYVGNEIHNEPEEPVDMCDAGHHLVIGDTGERFCPICS